MLANNDGCRYTAGDDDDDDKNDGHCHSYSDLRLTSKNINVYFPYHHRSFTIPIRMVSKKTTKMKTRRRSSINLNYKCNLNDNSRRLSPSLLNSHHKLIVMNLNWSSLTLLIILILLSSTIEYSFQFSNSYHEFIQEQINSQRKEIPCGHIPPRPDQIRFAHIGNHFSSNNRNKRDRQTPSSIISQQHQNLRIKYFYDESVQKITKEKFLIIDKVVLPEAISYWQQALFVKPFTVPIMLNRRCIQESLDSYLGFNQNYCIQGCEEQTLCGEVVIPEQHLADCMTCDETGKKCTSREWPKDRTGIEDADFVFYISTLQSNRCSKSSTIAYAAHCQQETTFYRPIAGHANICPDSISTKPQDLETLISTFKHEILHALGFSVSLYAFYRDPNGNQINPPVHRPNGAGALSNNNQGSSSRSNFSSNGGSMLMISKKILQRVQRKNWMVRGGNVTNNVFVISTPNVVREVRNHFNCSILEGAELENQGEDGTLLTHWEKRLFENEAMTGTHTQNPVYSRITLALMEDTGWYGVNYSLAQPLEWGRNLGCDFAMKSCKEWMDTKRAQGLSIHPFCDRVKKDPLQTECTDNRDSVALCNLSQYDHPLDKKFQNFDHIRNVSDEHVSYYGGSVVLADYCPYIQEFTWKQKNETVRGSKCSFEENNPMPEKNFALEHYGSDSKCMNHGDDMWIERNCKEIRQWQHWGSGCYQYQCSEEGFLNIIIKNHTYVCLHENQEIKIQLSYNDWLHKGSIICPRCSELCPNCKQLYPKQLAIMINQTKYDRDVLKCSASPNLFLSATSSFTLMIIMIIQCSLAVIINVKML